MTATTSGAVVCAGALARCVELDDVVYVFHKLVYSSLCLVKLNKLGVLCDKVVKLVESVLNASDNFSINLAALVANACESLLGKTQRYHLVCSGNCK